MRIHSCGLLLLVLFALLPLADSAQAGKKRRSGSLERLRERDAGQRWEELQKTFNPLTAGPPAGAAATMPAPGWQPTVERPPAPPAERVPQSAEPGGFPAVDAAAAEPAAPGISATGAENAVREVFDGPSSNSSLETQPVWIFSDEGAAPLQTAQSTQDMLRSGREPATEGNPPLSPDSSVESRPKPITSILPYHDYSPDGDSPCKFLCPRPEGCPEDRARPCPEFVELPDIPFESRVFAETHVTWAASNLFSNPLYFEDIPLERYGHTHQHLIQPLVSLGKFGVQLVGLPYQIALHPVHECRYALGFYRPGECAPYKYYLPPWNAKAALTAGAVYTGLFYVIP